MSRYDILAAISDERDAQDAKWGEQNHPDGTGGRDAAVMAAALRTQCDARHRQGRGTFADILAEEVAEAFAEEDPGKLRTELVQVAAVAAAWVEAIDRRQARRAA
jgi:hypothetical protein